MEEMIEFSQVYTIADKFKNVRLIAFPVCLGPISSSGCNWSIEEISSFTEILKASDSLIYLPVKV